MINGIQERRIKKEAGYHVTLEIPEKEYLQIYEDVNEDAASHIVDVFLNYYQDDGRPQNIEINHDKQNHMISISTLLTYEGNDHTDPRPTPHHLH
ncbi:hypothetical protein [Alkaliphilus crotonatoxidans]